MGLVQVAGRVNQQARVNEDQERIIQEQGRTIQEQGRTIQEQGRTIQEQGRTMQDQDRRGAQEASLIEQLRLSNSQQEKINTELRSALSRLSADVAALRPSPVASTPTPKKPTAALAPPSPSSNLGRHHPGHYVRVLKNVVLY
jgi:DNA repair exonuclease SbcCD ATPase subunit